MGRWNKAANLIFKLSNCSKGKSEGQVNKVNLLVQDISNYFTLHIYDFFFEKKIS